MGIISLVLRGISGVGKSVLSHLLEEAIKKIGKRVVRVSKDEYREYLREREGYHYTKEEEERVTEWYRETYRKQSQRTDIDYIICDNTHTRENEIMIPCTPQGNVSKIIVVFVGNSGSITHSTIGDDIIERQRMELQHSVPKLIELYSRGDIEWFDVPPRQATPQDADDMISDCELMNL